VLLVDPVSQVIEKKHHIDCNFNVDEDLDPWEVLAIRDRMFFILDDMVGMIWVNIVTEPGSKAVAKRFCLEFPVVR
jgi:hypothetical protein